MADQDPYERKDTEVFPTEQFGATTAQPTTAQPTTAQPGADEPGRRRDVDAGSLVTGLLFIALAILLMAGVDVSIDWFGHGIAWVLLIGAGVALLVNEVRRSRRRR